MGLLDHALGWSIGAHARHPLKAAPHVSQRLAVRVEPELALSVEVAAVPEAGDRGQVVRRDGAQRQAGKPFGRIALEPRAPVRQHAVTGESLAHAVLDGAEVLADDEGAGARAFERHDAEQVSGGIADVATFGRWEPGRDPEQPEQPHDVIDADSARVAERGPDGLDERPVAGGAQAMRDERRQPPVLSRGHVTIGRRADRRPERQRILPRPRVGAVGIHADRQVLHQGQASAARAS